jgi:hypothetical protein
MVKRKCKYCGKEFEPKTKNQVFCSLECDRTIYNSSGYMKIYYNKNKKRMYEQNRKRIIKEQEKWNKYLKEYYKKNKEKNIENSTKRTMFAYFLRKNKGGLCVVCGKKVDEFYEKNKQTCLKCRLNHLYRDRLRSGVIDKRFEITECIVCGNSIKNRISLCKYCVECANKIKELHDKYKWRTKECILFIKEGIRPSYRKGIGGYEKLSPPVQTSNSTSLTSEEPKGFNKDYQETSAEVSQIPNGTSDNSNIMPNLRGELQAGFNSNFKHCSTQNRKI